MTEEQRERAILRLMELYPMTREEAMANVAGLERGLKDIAAGRVTPLSQIEKEEAGL